MAEEEALLGSDAEMMEGSEDFDSEEHDHGALLYTIGCHVCLDVCVR